MTPSAAEPPFDPGGILRILDRHGVRYLVVGGVAGNIHGSKSFTYDLDICYAVEPDDLERLSRALTELEVSLRGADAGLPFRPDVRTLRNGLNFTFSTRFGAFDCLGEASGYTYEVLAPNAVRGDFGGYGVLVVALDDLIRMKRAAGRPEDLAEVARLEKLREVREEHGLFGLAEPGAARVAPKRRATTRAAPRRKARRPASASTPAPARSSRRKAGARSRGRRS